MATDYECTLDEEELKKAKEELHEIPKERLGQVETFRKWIAQQPHLTCPTDTPWLLQYMRAAKFSQLGARKKLENFLRAMTDVSDWMHDIDMNDKRFQHIFKSGIFVPLPGRDDEGRKIMLWRLGHFDPQTKLFRKLDMMRAFVGFFHHTIQEEILQVNGILYLIDLTGFTLKHQVYWNVDDIRNFFRIWQDAFPARFKGWHYYNMNPAFEVLLQLCMPFMKKKLRERLHFHGNNLESVYNVLPKRMLPEEYLPDDYKGPSAGPVDKLIEDFTKELTAPETVAHVLSVTQKKYGIDKSKKDKSEPQTSFRKLNID